MRRSPQPRASSARPAALLATLVAALVHAVAAVPGDALAQCALRVGDGSWLAAPEASGASALLVAARDDDEGSRRGLRPAHDVAPFAQTAARARARRR
jgi:hypothetical protein